MVFKFYVDAIEGIEFNWDEKIKILYILFGRYSVGDVLPGHGRNSI